MSIVKADITISLDGYLAGPNDGPEFPLGEGGERLHQWVYELESWREHHGMSGGKQNQDSDIVEESVHNVGAVLMGRRMFNNGEAPWGEEPPFYVPVFVVTHHAREPLVKEGGTTFYFVTDGIESALRQAQEAANGKDISVAGGGNLIQRLLTLGVLDELQIHIAPVLLGAGRRLFDTIEPRQIELECTRVVESPVVTHLKYRVVK